MKPIIVTEERAEKLQAMAAKRQHDLTILMENVHDPHNLGAVLRTCDSVGIIEIYALYTVESPLTLENIKGHKSSSGSKKWVDIHYFTDVSECVAAIKKKYKHIYGTHLGAESKNIYDTDLSDSVALVFGNENRGISDELLELLDGNFLIPQVGMVKSLNISVACAVSLYEALRQRMVKGKYEPAFDTENKNHVSLFEKYQGR